MSLEMEREKKQPHLTSKGKRQAKKKKTRKKELVRSLARGLHIALAFSHSLSRRTTKEGMSLKTRRKTVRSARDMNFEDLLGVYFDRESPPTLRDTMTANKEEAGAAFVLH